MPYRAVLAGCGAMSKGWLSALAGDPALAGRVEIVGLTDIDVGQARARAGEFGLSGAQVGANLSAMLGELKPDLLLDVVVPEARRDVVMAGLQHGCHVLSEKPMATSMAQAREMVTTASDAGRLHAIVQNRRFVPGIRRIRRMVEQGALGELASLNCDFFIGAHFGGFRDEMEHPLLLDMAIHTFDAARFISGKTPLAVYCLETNPPGSWYAHGAAANAIFELTDNVVFNYRGSWSAEGANTSWESSWRIVGTKGTLLWDGYERFEAKRVSGNSGFFRDLAELEVPPAGYPSQTDGHASVLAEFLGAIDDGRTPETAGSDNINSLSMVFGAIESARTGTRVAIST